MIAAWESYRALIHADRVSPSTRAALLARRDDPAYQPRTLSPDAFATLRALLARILPQDRVDLAQRLDTQWAEGQGDGWRFAALPADAAAAREGLADLDAAAFTELTEAAQDALLDRIAAGSLGERPKLWFEDLRGQATMLYVADPTTMARIGYSGIAYGTDGFHAIGPGERDPWEPEPAR